MSHKDQANTTNTTGELNMTRYQVIMVGICIMLNMNDGVDVLTVSFSSTDIMKEWALSQSLMGYVFSSGLIGMMLGSFLIAPLSDHYGRKKIFILSLLMISAGMMGVAFCTGYSQLLVLRLITGAGIGGILPALASTASEFSSEKNKDLNVALVQAGWPIGSILTGVVCAYSIPAWGWRSTFLIAGIFALCMLAVVVIVMKEYVPQAKKNNAATFKDLFQPAYRNTTFKIWISVFCGVLTLYTLLSWVPAIAKNAGLPFTLATYVGIVLNIGSATGTILIGVIAKHTTIGLKKTVFIFLLAATAVMLLYATAAFSAIIIFVLIFLIGIFVQGGFNGNYPILARVYPGELRATGIGMAIGIGRAGAIIGPSLFGILADNGITVPVLFCIFSLPLLISAVSIFSLRSAHLS